MLTRFDAELVGWLMEKFSEIEVEVRTSTAVEAVEAASGQFRVRARSGSQTVTIEADLVIHSAGRGPDLQPLNLDAAGVAVEKGRLVLNEFLQSVSNPIVYAAGDAAAKGPPLTPVSSHDGRVVAANLLDGNKHRPDYRGVPSVAFTLPPIAAVGMGEDEARRAGIKFRAKSEKAANWYYGAPGRRNRLRIQDAGRRRDRTHSWRSHRWSARRRDHQYLRSGYPK